MGCVTMDLIAELWRLDKRDGDMSKEAGEIFELLQAVEIGVVSSTKPPELLVPFLLPDSPTDQVLVTQLEQCVQHPHARLKFSGLWSSVLTERNANRFMGTVQELSGQITATLMRTAGSVVTPISFEGATWEVALPDDVEDVDGLLTPLTPGGSSSSCIGKGILHIQGDNLSIRVASVTQLWTRRREEYHVSSLRKIRLRGEPPFILGK